jgi:hypothetical protein
MQVTLNAKRCFNKDVSYVAVDYNNHETKPVVRHSCSLPSPCCPMPLQSRIMLNSCFCLLSADNPCADQCHLIAAAVRRQQEGLPQVSSCCCPAPALDHTPDCLLWQAGVHCLAAFQECQAAQ